MVAVGEVLARCVDGEGRNLSCVVAAQDFAWTNAILLSIMRVCKVQYNVACLWHRCVFPFAAELGVADLAMDPATCSMNNSTRKLEAAVKVDVFQKETVCSFNLPLTDKNGNLVTKPHPFILPHERRWLGPASAKYRMLAPHIHVLQRACCSKQQGLLREDLPQAADEELMRLPLFQRLGPDNGLDC